MAGNKTGAVDSLEWAPLGNRNIEYVAANGYTYYRHRNDATYERGEGGSTKTDPVATTGGNVTMPSGITVGISAYRKR